MVIKFMTLANRNIVVTGGAGFIGSWLAETLAEGNEVNVLDNLSAGKIENLQHIRNKIRVIRGDVRNAETVAASLKGTDVVFHEAANVQIQASIEDPIMDSDINIGGTLNVLEACRLHDVSRIVFASSSAIYGDTGRISITEERRLNPVSPYAVSKMAGESYVKLYNQLYGLETVSLRYFNVYGPRQNSDSPYSGVISIFTKNMKDSRKVTVFGDGKQTRDFVDVRDVVRANVLAATSKKAVGKAINVGTGKSVSLNEMIRILEKISGKGLKVVYKPQRKGDIKDSLADTRLAEELLGFKATISLKEGLRELLSGRI